MVVAEPAQAIWSMRRKDDPWAADALQGTLRTYARRNKASLVVFKDFPENYRSALETLVSNAYARIPSMPMTRLPLPYANWDEYFGTLSKATRKDLRRKFRKAEGAPKNRNGGGERHHTFGRRNLSAVSGRPRAIATEVRNADQRLFPRRCSADAGPCAFFIWRQNGKIVAFSFCLVCGDAIYDECIGLDYSVALDLHLYFYTLRDILSWSLQQGLKYYYSNPLNYEPKLHLTANWCP